MDEHQSYAGVETLSVDTIAPIVRRGVLLDIAGPLPLTRDYVITPEELERAAAGLEIHPGDIVPPREPVGRATGTIPAATSQRFTVLGLALEGAQVAEQQEDLRRPARTRFASNTFRIRLCPSMCIYSSKAASTSWRI